MKKERYLDKLINTGLFRFHHLLVEGIDNETVAKVSSSSILEQEYCLFSNKIRAGDEYFRLLHNRIIQAMQNKQPLPVVRFADGEYKFYRYSLRCNGLYKQAESIAAIKRVMPVHIAAMEYLVDHGILAPLVFPGNSHVASRNIFSFRKKKTDSLGADFLDFLYTHHINLNAQNYVPFYVVYAYLSSAEFAAAINGKNICIVNSGYNKESCRQWFARLNSSPGLEFVDIPQEYTATQWEEIKAPILSKIPARTDLCIVGGGIGALLICTDITQRYSIPVIDAGYVLDMMNDRLDKSKGRRRLYTIYK
ncbi:MAG: hypothetical protein JW765_12235 [Deltaproteobacteria bacterium]|nr:hypothetical protein [Candidatus Zymogenaceae bacterium]